MGFLAEIFMKKFEINKWTKRQLRRLPSRGWNEDIGEFDSLVILPTKRMHDSGFRIMDFVAVKDNKPICKLSGCSDVLHIDGIGGYGNWNLGKRIPKSIPPKGWSIDCLERSGLLRLFSDGELTVGAALSSFEIFSKERETLKTK
jgi:hypothetical protein